MSGLISMQKLIELVATNHNKMVNNFVFSNYAAIAANMPDHCGFCAPSDSFSERSKTGVNLTFGLSFGLKL